MEGPGLIVYGHEKMASLMYAGVMNAAGVSTWTLHRTLGQIFPNSPDAPVSQTEAGDGDLTIHGLVEKVVELGYAHVEMCHFHLPFGDPAVAETFARHDLQLGCLLIDGGDWTHPDLGGRDAAWITDWTRFAQDLGARRVRVIAGKTRTPDALKVAADRFAKLAADVPGIELSTENWFDVLAEPADVKALMRDVPELRLCLDFGNWTNPNKYERLAEIAADATYSHAKADFHPQTVVIEADDYDACLQLMKVNGYTGPYTVVNGGSLDPWAALAATRTYIENWMA
jgi:sugar phosphate isomerase/epimerase